MHLSVVSGQDKMDHLLVSQQSTFLMCEACTDEVPKNLVIPSCNLQLSEPVGQGNEPQYCVALYCTSEHSYHMQESLGLFTKPSYLKASTSYSVIL